MRGDRKRGTVARRRQRGGRRVYWAVVNKEGDEVVQHFDIFGGRDDVRDKATTHGLRLVRDFIDLHEELEVI